MATSADYIDYVMDLLFEIRVELRFRKMFGEYCIYANDKPVMLVCDNTVFIKMLPCIEPLMQEASTGMPYQGAKTHYIADVEDRELMKKIIPILEQNTPLPKPKTRKKKEDRID